MTREEALLKLKSFEGFRAVAYQDAVGVWTIGYGRTGNITKGMTTTREAEEKWLSDKFDSLCSIVKKHSDKYNYGWNDSQIFVLADFIYNLGSGCLSQLTANGTRDNTTIAEKIKLYNKAGGRVLQGLVKRRTWESEEFKKAMTEAVGNSVNARMLFKFDDYDGYYEFANQCTNDKAYFQNIATKEIIKIDEVKLNEIKYSIVFIGV